MTKILFSARDNRGSSWKKSPIMQKWLENPRIRAALNESGELRQFFDDFEKSTKGKVVTTEVMRQFFDKKSRDKTDKISDNELRIISEEILGKGWKRYYTHEATQEKSANSGAGTVKAGLTEKPNKQTVFEKNFALARSKDIELRRSRDLEAKLNRKEKDLNEKLGKKETANSVSPYHDHFGGHFDKKPGSSEDDPEDHPSESVISKLQI
jgi:hypothetical protein